MSKKIFSLLSAIVLPAVSFAGIISATTATTPAIFGEETITVIAGASYVQKSGTYFFNTDEETIWWSFTSDAPAGINIVNEHSKKAYITFENVTHGQGIHLVLNATDNTTNATKDIYINVVDSTVPVSILNNDGTPINDIELNYGIGGSFPYKLDTSANIATWGYELLSDVGQNSNIQLSATQGNVNNLVINPLLSTGLYNIKLNVDITNASGQYLGSTSVTIQITIRNGLGLVSPQSTLVVNEGAITSNPYTLAQLSGSSYPVPGDGAWVLTQSDGTSVPNGINLNIAGDNKSATISTTTSLSKAATWNLILNYHRVGYSFATFPITIYNYTISQGAFVAVGTAGTAGNNTVAYASDSKFSKFDIVDGSGNNPSWISVNSSGMLAWTNDASHSNQTISLNVRNFDQANNLVATKDVSMIFTSVANGDDAALFSTNSAGNITQNPFTLNGSPDTTKFSYKWNNNFGMSGITTPATNAPCVINVSGVPNGAFPGTVNCEITYATGSIILSSSFVTTIYISNVFWVTPSPNPFPDPDAPGDFIGSPEEEMSYSEGMVLDNTVYYAICDVDFKVPNARFDYSGGDYTYIAQLNNGAYEYRWGNSYQSVIYEQVSYIITNSFGKTYSITHGMSVNYVDY